MQTKKETTGPARRITHAIFSPLKSFLSDSRAVGIVLVACTVVSLVLSNNSRTGEVYRGWWTTAIASPGGLSLPHDCVGWINDWLMVFFFFLVGMEIKRELLAGELATLRKSLLPVAGALGGMVVPAVIFAVFNHGTPFHHGWGIPMATDIAFSLGILSLLGDRVPLQLKVFLTALAIIDDLGAIVVIALFYSTGVHWGYLAGALLILCIPVALNLLKSGRLILYLIPGIGVWYCLLNSGIHPTIAGVMMAFCIPLRRIPDLERALYDVVNFLIMPLFALANTAILFPANVAAVMHSPIAYGVVLGLFLGKPVGITLFSYVSVKLGIAQLPSGARWKQMWGVGMIAGIGFTMSIFIATLAFGSVDEQVISKMAVLAASVLAGVSGYCFIRWLSPNPGAGGNPGPRVS